MSAAGPTAPTPEDPELAPWKPLRESLAGSFSARAKGLLGSEFALLDGDGEPFGSLRLRGTEGADLEAGDLRAEIRPTPHPGHAMRYATPPVTPPEGASFLHTAPPDASGALKIVCGGRPYEARFGLLRNVAEARRVVDAADAGDAAGPSGIPGGATRVTGGLTNRGYEAAFDRDDAGALPVAVFLLYRTVSMRRRAYRAAART